MSLTEPRLLEPASAGSHEAEAPPEADEDYLYERIATHFEQAIAQQALGVGARMPSVREIRRLHHVSHSTALQVLRVLEARGLIEARPRVGYFVRDTALQMPAAR